MCELVSQTASSLTFPRSLSLLPSSQNPPTNLGYLQFWCCGAKIFHWSPFFLRAVQTKLTRSQSHVALLMLGEVLAWWRATSRSSMCCKTSEITNVNETINKKQKLKPTKLLPRFGWRSPTYIRIRGWCCNCVAEDRAKKCQFPHRVGWGWSFWIGEILPWPQRPNQCRQCWRRVCLSVLCSTCWRDLRSDKGQWGMTSQPEERPNERERANVKREQTTEVFTSESITQNHKHCISKLSVDCPYVCALCYVKEQFLKTCCRFCVKQGWHFDRHFQKFGLFKWFSMKKCCLACFSGVGSKEKLFGL